MKIIRNRIVTSAIFCALCLTTMAAKTIYVTGTVTDENNAPVEGAIVRVPGMVQSAISGADGTFSIQVPSATSELRCSYLGYRDVELEVKQDAKMSIKLQPDYSLQDALIGNGLGQKVSQTGYTGARSTVGAADISKTPSMGLDQTLTGRLSGMTAQQGSSAPSGDYTSKYIRGIATTAGNAILYVLDGVPAPTLSPNSLDPNTIESVTILKDAAAKAIYGPLGAQGVMLITTKHGHAGKTNVHIDLNYAVNGFTKDYEPMDAYDYAVLRNQALTNDNLPALYSEDQLEAFKAGTGVNNNWKKRFLHSSTTTQTYNVSADGGTDRIQFYLNAGYAHQDGIYKTEYNSKYNPAQYYNRFTVVSNVKVNMFKYLDASLNTNVRIYRNNESASGAGSIIQSVMLTPATVPGPLSEDGRIITTENFGNPTYGQINRTGYDRGTGTDVNANFALNLDMSFLTKGLSANARVGYHSYYAGTIHGRTDYTRYIYNGYQLSQFGSNVDSPLSLSKSSNTVYFMNIQGSILYDRTFLGRLNVNAMANYLAEDRISTSFSSKWVLPYRRIQYAGQLHLGWDDKYFAQVAVTDAGTEEFQKGNQFKVSPTVSAAWAVSNESFMKHIGWLNLLKFRASYGELKYDNIYAIGRLLYSSDIRQENGAGYINSLYTAALIKEYLIGNTNITWEDSHQQNYGVDFCLLNSVKGSFDYWRTTQKGVITKDYSKPAVTGITSGNLPYENLGIVKSHGYEMTLSYDRKYSNGLEVGLTGILSYNTNKVIEMREEDLSSNGYVYAYRQTGYPIGQQFGYLVDYSNGNGFYNTLDEIEESKLTYEGMRAPRLGDLRYRDLNNDGVINKKDLAPLPGTKSLPSYSYSLDLDLGYGGFDFSMMWQGTAGKSSYYNGAGIHEDYSQGSYSAIHQSSWTAERYAAGDEILYPALSTGGALSLEANDFLVSKNDYVRLKNLVIGYSLPERIIKKWGMTKFRLFLSGENLVTFTNFKFKNIDPEQSDFYSYPMYRIYNLGININF